MGTEPSLRTESGWRITQFGSPPEATGTSHPVITRRGVRFAQKCLFPSQSFGMLVASAGSSSLSDFRAQNTRDQTGVPPRGCVDVGRGDGKHQMPERTGCMWLPAYPDRQLQSCIMQL